jgi:hypothetical protein
MDGEARFEQWLDDHGFQGSVAFNFSFFFLQLVLWSVIIVSLVVAIIVHKSIAPR